METRKITIVSTKNQSKKVIMSAATTLAELKSDLRECGIDYTGMTFYEGTSKTELKTDESVLPHDVPYKGTTTNELVFMLTNTNKKIKSGAMSRAKAYAAIKANNLQAECVKKFGKNFTMCKTSDLISLLENANKKSSPKTKCAEAPSTATEKSVQAPATAEIVDTKARKAIAKIATYLYNEDVIDVYDRDEILEILEEGEKEEVQAKEDSSPYSNDEIDNMFDFVK